LLTAPLLAGQGKRSNDLLTASEYRKLARHLRARGNQPADLMASAAERLLDDCGRIVERARLERLLGRGFLLGQALEHWRARAIWVVSRADETYPKRLKERLKDASPPLLYGCGDSEILDHGGLAVVGSRHVHEALIELTEAVGRLAAAAGKTIVSGGARGIDQAAMRGALEAGGRVAGVLADGLERAVMRREHRNLLLEGRLVLISPYDPSASFNVGHAMQRNKLIYALADAGLVVSAEEGRGGTWAGAVEQLEKLRFVPVYVRATGEDSKGLDALRRKGAQPWPSPVDAAGMKAALAAPTKANTDRSAGASLHHPVQVQLFRASGSGEEGR
jgi:predicted Rossmann fold nucleotide-binding protein DprA/Smf involved in DNA uptake